MSKCHGLSCLWLRFAFVFTDYLLYYLISVVAQFPAGLFVIVNHNYGYNHSLNYYLHLSRVGQQLI